MENLQLETLKAFNVDIDFLILQVNNTVEILNKQKKAIENKIKEIEDTQEIRISTFPVIGEEQKDFN